MWSTLRNLYARRIVNVNVNILLAGVLALGPVLLVVNVAWALGLDRDYKAWIPIVTFVTDVIADVAIYYVLHWFANSRLRQHLAPGHAPRADASESVSLDSVAASARPILKDATVVQMQRMVLSPVLYGLWLGTQWALLHAGFGITTATCLGFLLGIAVARTIHTAWMLHEERSGPVRWTVYLGLALASISAVFFAIYYAKSNRTPPNPPETPLQTTNLATPNTSLPAPTALQPQ